MDLDLIADSTANQIREDEMSFQAGMAESIVKSSGGRLEGFDVSREGDVIETDFFKAKRNINLAGSINPDQEAAALRASRKTGLPVPLLRAMDNQDMNKPDLAAAAPETLRFIGDNLSNAAVVKDDVDKINDVVETAQYASMSPEERRNSLMDKIQREGYTPAQIADLKAEGMSVLPEDPSGKNGKFTLDAMKSLNATVTWPVLEKWYSGPGEVDQLKRQKEAREKWDKTIRKGFDNVRGSTWLLASTPETADDYIKRLDKEIVVMGLLYAVYGDQWRSFGDKELETAVKEVGAAVKLDVSDMSVARFRPAGVGWETDWAQVFNMFGIVSAMEHRTKLSQKELDEVHRDPSKFSMADKMELVDYLEDQARALRSRTGWNNAVEGTLASLPYMAEIGLSGGTVAPSALKRIFGKTFVNQASHIAKVRALRVQNFLKTMGLDFLASSGKQAMRVGLETAGEANPHVTQILRDGAVLPGMTEDRTSEIANIFFNKMLDSYIEYFSEGMGGLIPTGKLLAPVLKRIPQRIKNAAFVQIAKNVIGNVSTSKGAKLSKIVYERSMFNGFMGEYLEEKWGDAMRKTATSLAQALGTRYGDLGQKEIFGTPEEEMQLMGSLLLTSGLISTVRIPSLVGDVRRAAQFVDAERAVKDRVDATTTEQRSPETMEYLLRHYTDKSDTAYITPGDARTLYQSSPEVMENIGVTEDMIGQAESMDRMIPVSMARVQTRTDRAAFDGILAKLIPDPRHTLTPEQAEKVDFSNEALAVAKATDEARAEAKTAYDEALAQLSALGRPATEIRAAAKLLSMAEYFARHSDMTAAEWIRNVAFEKMKEEDFLKRLAEQQQGAMYQVSPVWTGSAANYSEPSLQAVGTGEGAQVYGWGLYGSSERGVGEEYARADVQRKGKPVSSWVTADGKEVSEETMRSFLQEEGFSFSDAEGALSLLSETYNYETPVTDTELIEALREAPAMETPDKWAAAELLEKFPGLRLKGGRHLYKQTFWPGKQENLLDWDRDVTAAQYNKIISQLYSELQTPDDAQRRIIEHLEKNKELGFSGQYLYKSFVDILGSPKAASEFLYRAGIDGITYIGGSSNVRNYVAFSDKDIRIDDHIMYQSGTARRGATTFNSAWEAAITLFEGAADASTLIHETGHYAFEMMRHLVETGAADERMQSDFAKLQKWAEEGTSDPMEQKERLARGLEAYCIEGKAPTIELEGAFATLRRLLMHIYKSVKALGVELNDEVRTVFDGMLASDETLNNESILREVTSQIDKELLGLTQSEVKMYRDLIEKSNEQALAELTAEKNRELARLRLQWRQEANDLMKGERVYNAWNAILKEGGIDYVALEEICGEYLASILRKKGLTTNPGRKSKEKVDKKTGEVIRPAGYYSAKSGKHPASFAAENGFDSVEQMVDELAYAKSPKDFMAEYLADSERRFHAEFEMSEGALSVQASVEALEKLSDLLAVKGGKQGTAIRRAALKRQALDEIAGMKVRDIVSDKKLIADCKLGARKLTKAANDGDFAAAFEHSRKLRYNLEVLRQKAAAKKAIAKTERFMNHARKAKKIRGSHHDALVDLSFRFGFLNNLPKKPLQHTVASVIEEHNNSAREDGEAPINVPSLFLAGSHSYGDLSFGELQGLTQLAEFIYGEGRALVSEHEAQLKEQVAGLVARAVETLAPQKHNKVKHGKVMRVLYDVPEWGTKLRNILDEAGLWEEGSVFMELYGEMNFAESMQYEIMRVPLLAAREAFDALYASLGGRDFSELSHIKFPTDVVAHGYRKWDAEKVVMCCLNMGTAKNRQRLKDGFSSPEYQWTEDTFSEIASLLTEEDWANIQKLWDTIGGRGKPRKDGEVVPSLRDRVFQTFRDERYTDLIEEEPYPFGVITADGKALEIKGGYLPLDYLYHQNTVVQDMTGGSAQHNLPAFRRASFEFERAEELSDPLNLSVNIVTEHIFDAAHYVTHRKVMRKILRVINDSEFRKHFQQTQGFERYDAMKKLIENIAAPGAAMKGFTNDFEDWMRAVVTASALVASPSAVAMQLGSVTLGADELGSYWFEYWRDSMADPIEAREEAFSKSGLMRDRVNLADLDLKRSTGRFQKGKAERIRDRLVEYGYAPMRFVDLIVAVPLWRAAYHKAADRGIPENEAIAIADEFVAKTQGATRAIDMSTAQLTAWGRCVTLFFSASSAASTLAVKTVKKVAHRKYSPAGAALAIGATVLAPVVIGSVIRALLAGSPDDDPDKARRAFLRELITNPFQGVPLIRDAADFVAGGVSRAATGKPFMLGKRTVFENTMLRGASDIVIAATDAALALAEGNMARVLYKASDAAGRLFKVPVVGVYDRAQRMIADWTNDPDLLPNLNELTKTER